MKIKYSITFNQVNFPNLLNQIKKQKIEYQEISKIKLVTINYYADDPQRNFIDQIIKQTKLSELYSIEYSKEDYTSEAYALRNYYSPQYNEPSTVPDDFSKWIDSVYDLSEGCNLCTFGKKQVKHFKFKKSEAPKNSNGFQIQWIKDEIIVSGELLKTLNKTIKIGSRPILGAKGEETDFQQLNINNYIDDEIKSFNGSNISELNKYKCEKCDHEFSSLQFFQPALILQKDQPITGFHKTRQKMSDGVSEWPFIIIDKNVYNTIKKYRTNLKFDPIHVTYR